MEGGDSPAACLNAQGSWSGIQAGMGGWTPSIRLEWWDYQQKVQWGAGCCAPTPREDLAHTHTAERQHSSLSSCSSLEISWLSEEKSRS